MNAREREAVDQLANALQTINILSTKLRTDLGEAAEDALKLEGASARAVNAMKQLQPKRRTRD